MVDPLLRFEGQLGVSFGDRKLLRQALTHRSRGRENNERLEFLGDSVLGFVVTEWLYHRFPDITEGKLSISIGIHYNNGDCSWISMRGNEVANNSD